MRGNRCVFPGCNQSLIVDDVNITNACHIISEKPNGPRHIPGYNNWNYDDDNLILLCRNHHGVIDTNVKKYTMEYLKNMKINHENNINSLLNQDNGENKIILKNVLKAVSEFNLKNIIVYNDFYKFEI